MFTFSEVDIRLQVSCTSVTSRYNVQVLCAGAVCKCCVQVYLCVDSEHMVPSYVLSSIGLAMAVQNLESICLIF